MNHTLERNHRGGLLIMLLIVALIAMFGEVEHVEGQEDDEPRPLAPVRSFRHYTTSDGLPSSEINALHQDQQGFMWIGTDDGLVRFDGHQFTVFKQNAVDRRAGLSGNHITTILEDSAGVMWFGTWDHGFNRFDPQRRTFQGYGLPDILDEELAETAFPAPLLTPPGQGGNNQPYFGAVIQMVQDGEGKIWLSSRPNTPLVRFDIDEANGTIVDMSALPNGTILKMLADTQGGVWIITTEGVSRWHNGQIKVYLEEPVNENPDVTLAEGAKDHLGRVWLIFRGDVYLYDATSDELIAQPTPTVFVNDLAIDQSGLIWAATKRGLYRFDPDAAEWQLFALPNPVVQDGLLTPDIHKIYIDRDSNVWFTHDRGLSIFATKQQLFSNYRADPLHLENSLLPAPITSITGRDGELWLGSDFDLTHVSADGIVSHIPLPGEGLRRATALTMSRNGGIWVGTSQPSLFYFDPDTVSFTEIELEREARAFSPQPWVTAIEESEEGELWVVILRQSVHRIDIDTGEQIAYPLARQRPGPPPQVNEPMVTDELIFVPSQLKLTADGQVWIGSSSEGPGLLNPETNQFSYQPLIPPRGVNVNDIHVADDGTLWLASTLGLIHYLPETNENIVFDETRGLPATAVYHLEVDRLGYFWVTTNQGVVRFDPRSETVIHYDQRSGVFDVDFSEKGSWQDEDGRLYFGSHQGFISFDPAEIQLSDTDHPVVMTELKLFNEPVMPRDWSVLEGEPVLAEAIEVAESIRLGPEDNLVSFEFTTLTYGAPSRILYRYRLDGLEDDWNEVGSDRRFATYTNLSAGIYTFRVQATNEDGIWGEVETTLEVVVIPSWWETLWFRGVIIGVVAVLVILAARFRLWSLQTRNLELEQEVNRQTAVIQDAESQKRRLAVLEERQRIGRELHDDIGQVIGYVSVQSQTALNHLKRDEKVQTEATLQRLIRVAQDAHADIRQYILGIRQGGGTESQEGFLPALQAYLQNLEELYGLKVRLSLPSGWDSSPFPKDTETQLLRIIQESLNNARKHAQTNQASILFLDGGEQVQMIVSDEGVGFEIDEVQGRGQDDHTEANHFGLTIMQERADSFGGELEIRTAVGSGTEIIVQIPKQLEADPERAVAGLSVLLVDDHRLYMEGIANLLRTRGVNVVGMAGNGLEAQARAAELRPELILMDVDMPVCNGLEATRVIKERFPDMKIVMLTVAADEQKLYTALQHGASGYLLKSMSGSEFFHMLRDAMYGETALSPQLAAKLLNSFAQNPELVASADKPVIDRDLVGNDVSVVSTVTNGDDGKTAEPIVLTFRQQQVLELVVQGMSNREISEQLFVSENTVKRHVSRILTQFQLKSRYELAHFYANQSDDSEG